MATITRSVGGGYAVTTDNANDLPTPAVGLYVGGAGDIKVDDFQGHTFTFKAVPVGTQLMCPVKRVYATGTTATLLIALVSP